MAYSFNNLWGLRPLVLVNYIHPTARQILDAASLAFAERGYEATSIAQIADGAGVVDAAIYRHFESKRHLLHEVIRGFYEPLIASARQGVSAIDSPRDKIRFLVRRHLLAMVEDRFLCRLVISEARSLDDYYTSDVADLSRSYTALLIAAVSEGMASGDFRDDLDPSVVRDLVYGSIEHLGWATLVGEATLDIEASTDQLMALILGGIDMPALSIDTNLDRFESLVERMEAQR